MNTQIRQHCLAKLPPALVIATLLLWSWNLIQAGDFSINAGGVVVSATDTGSASNNVDIGYGNTITNSPGSFIYGGTNIVTNAANAMIIGGNNNITSPTSLDTAYIFGEGNNMDINGSGDVWLFGSGNTIINHAGNHTRNDNLSNAFAFGADNMISNVGYMHDVYAFGVNNIIRGGRNIGGLSDVSRVFAFGADNDLHNMPSSETPTLTNAYAFGGGNMMGGAGIFTNVYAFGANNRMLNQTNSTTGNLTGGYAFGEGNVINVPKGSDMANLYAIGVGNTMGESAPLAPGSTMHNVYAIGGNNYIVSSNVVAIGGNNSVTQDNIFILGNSVTGTNANGVILGNESADGVAVPTSMITIGDNVSASVAGSAPIGIVSVGAVGKERQIINVAAGRVAAGSTDAINGSQLYITNTTLSAIGKTVAALAASGTGNTTANVVAYDGTAKNTITLGGPTVSGSGANMTGGTRITNLALAAVTAASADAVAGSQLFDTNMRVANLENIVVTITGTANPPVPPVTPAANPLFSTGGDDPAIPAIATGGNAVAAGMGATAGGSSTTAIGAGAKATAANAIAIGSLSEAQAAEGVALGNNAVVVAAAANSAAIGANSIATEPNTVSFGSATLQRRLVNIADGINPHDAVNMRQFTDFENTISGRFGGLQTQIDTVSDRLDRLGAMSAAINQVQTHPPPNNNNQLALGLGVYRDHSALALGYGYTCRLTARGMRASFALSDNGDIMAGAGVVFGW
jgi:autotransporter adhesin